MFFFGGQQGFNLSVELLLFFGQRFHFTVCAHAYGFELGQTFLLLAGKMLRLRSGLAACCFVRAKLRLCFFDALEMFCFRQL